MTSQTSLQVNLTTWVIESVFYLSVVLAVLYIPSYDWWKTFTGTATAILPVGLILGLLRAMLVIWNVPVIHLTGNGLAETTTGRVLSWVSICGLFLFAVALLTLCVMCVVHIRSDPEPSDKQRLMHRVLRVGKDDTRR